VSRATSRAGRRGQPTRAAADFSADSISAEMVVQEMQDAVGREGTAARGGESIPLRKSNSPKRILVLDPGFRSLTGHHYNINVALTEAAPAMNAEFRILAGDTCEDPGKLAKVTTPWFETDLYEGATQFAESWEFDSWLHVNAKFRRDLARIDEELLDWANIILIPAVTQFHMLALAKWLRETLERKPGLKAVIQLMFSPSWTAWDAVCESGEQMYADAFAYLVPYEGRRVFYCSELSSSAREFRHLLSSEISLLPHAGIWREARAGRSVSDGAPTIGYFGYAKREKGFHLLPDIVRDVRRVLPPSDAGFVVQINHGAYDPLIVQAERQLRDLAGPGLELRFGAMTEHDYLDAFESADIQLLPYDPELYRGRGSGVFSEAIGYGKTVIAPKSSGIGKEITQGHGAGVLFDRYNAQDIARALVMAVRQAPELSAHARSSASQWQKLHSGQGYLAVLDELVS
jgi:glycosyltransferase involved in cell wall biosynthesis